CFGTVTLLPLPHRQGIHAAYSNRSGSSEAVQTRGEEKPEKPKTVTAILVPTLTKQRSWRNQRSDHQTTVFWWRARGKMIRSSLNFAHQDSHFNQLLKSGPHVSIANILLRGPAEISTVIHGERLKGTTWKKTFRLCLRTAPPGRPAVPPWHFLLSPRFLSARREVTT
ncbi:hypothetical protein AVEN_254348-1, partial [Araneus ventricosus]